jgi:endonuclease YncB( thermonuclease family)
MPLHDIIAATPHGIRRRASWPAALLLALALLAPPAAAQRAEVIDGDTIRVAGVVVRMVGLDAPERRARCRAEARLADRATARLWQLVRPRVWLERRGQDRYRRTLAVVRDRAGRDLAQVMIREGLARPYDGRGRRAGWCGRGR